jgi:hypothetical protein
MVVVLFVTSPEGRKFSTQGKSQVNNISEAEPKVAFTREEGR